MSLHKVVVGRALLLCRAELPVTWREGTVLTALTVLEGLFSACIWVDGFFSAGHGQGQRRIPWTGWQEVQEVGQQEAVS